MRKGKVISISINEDLHQAFKEFTRRNGMSISGRIQYLIKKDIENSKKRLKSDE